MLPRKPGVVVFLALLLLMLAVLEEGFSADSSINIDLSLFQRSEARITIPCIATVMISGVSLSDCDKDISPLEVISCDPTIIIDVTDGCNNVTQLDFTEGKVLHLTISSDLPVACKNYIFNESLYEGLRNFTCEPVFGSNFSRIIAENINFEVTWSKFLYRDNLEGFINASQYEQLDFLDNDTYDDFGATEEYEDYVLKEGQHTPPGVDIRRGGSVHISFDSAGTGYRMASIELNVDDTGQNALGFYVPGVKLLEENITLRAPYFALYLSPDFTSDDDRNKSVIHGSDSAENYDSLQCRTESFPPAEVTWEFRKKGSSNYQLLLDEDHTTFRDISDKTPKRFYYTVDGVLVIDEVEYDDAGTYRCTATNTASGEDVQRSIILRVRDPLRPLWPALGIVASFIITAAFIIGSYVVDRVRGKEGVSTEEYDTRDTTTAGSGSDRHLSMTSPFVEEAENDSSGNSHKGVKRLSSAQQQLLSSTS